MKGGDKMGREIKMSFAEYHINNTDPDFINKYWSNKNTLDPWKIGYRSEKKIWILCQEKDYHNDFGGYETTPDNFTRGRRCTYCRGFKVHPKDSFAQWAIDNIDKNFLNKYWSTKNECDPWELGVGTSKKVWFKCQDKIYHDDYNMYIHNFIKGQRCPYCKGSSKVNYFDSLGFLYNDIAKMIVIDNRNNVTWDDMYNTSPHSNKKYYMTCTKCGHKKDKKVQINWITRKGRKFSCDICRNGFSTPERFMSKLLDKLNIKFKSQLNKSDFKWCKEYKYDFYLPDYNMIIETHGLQHYESTHKGSYFHSLKEQQQIDKDKEFLALNNNVDKYITIDCRKSTFKWISENIINELKDYINFKDIDLYGVWKESQESIVIKSWEMLDNGIDENLICEKLHICKSTLYNYKKRREK